MITDADLIRKLQVLKEIKPRKDWVSLTKSQILGDYQTSPESIFEVFPRLTFQPKLAYRPVFVTLVTFAVLMGTFGFAQYSLPGDILYPIKRVSERGQALFVSEKELPCYNLEIANKRLEDLTKIAESNQVNKLAPAISEFQVNVSEAAENLAKAKETDVKEIAALTRKLEENKKKVESLGVVVGETEELNDALKPIVEREIKSLEEQTLDEAQEEVLVQIKEDFEAGNYNQALIEILLINNH